MVEPLSTLPTQRDRQRAETRERIFQAACSEIDRVGLAAAQIPRIASAAGVVRGTFYFHFQTKEHVLFELIERIQEGLVQSMAQLGDSRVEIRQVMDELIEAVLRVETVLGQSNLMREMLAVHVRRLQTGESPSDEDGMLGQVARHLAVAAERGEVRAGIEPERLAGVVLTGIFGLMLTQQGNLADLRAELELLMELLLRGMAAD